MEFLNGNKIKVEPPKKIKKITGTKLPAILGVGIAGAYNTPFQIWCDMMRVYEKPFSESKYTIAGNFIEPKQAQYARDKYQLDNLLSPVDKFGPAASKAWDFYLRNEIFGGKWDFQICENDEQKSVRRVVECKTAQLKKKSEWENGGIPGDYYLQLGLYCWLEHVEKGTFIVSFLNPEEYDDPQTFTPNDENTIFVPVAYDLQRFEDDYITPVKKWYFDHCVNGISPAFNEIVQGDIDIVNELKNKIAKQNAENETPTGSGSTMYIKDIETPFN